MSECSTASRDFLSPAVLGAVIAFVATLAGVGLSELAAFKRMRRTQDLDWNRRLFDKYSDAYRDFLASWGGVGNPELLETTFTELRSRALVPASLEREHERALVGMRGSSDPDVRKDCARRLQAKIDQLLSDPVGLSSG